MKEEICEIVHEFNEKYQEEVGVDGHNVPKLLEKAYKKNDLDKIKEYETDLEIAKNLMDLDQKCTIKESFTKHDCSNFMRGIESWEYEYNFWTNKWYVKPFISQNKRQKSEEYIEKIKNTYKKVCD